MVTTDIWQIEQKPELVTALGRVTVRWASLDLLLIHITAVALRNYPAAEAIILADSNAGQDRLRTFERVVGASYFDERERSSILETFKGLGKLYRKRNELIHEPLVGRYTVTDNKQFDFHLTFLSRRGEVKKADVMDIDAHIEAVDKLLEKLESTLDALVKKYSPSDDG